MIFSQPAAAAAAFLHEVFCGPRGHQHPVPESWICAEAILARLPGSTGLASIKPLVAPPSLIEFNRNRCATHVHGAVNAGACLDKHFRNERERDVARLSALTQRAAMAARSSKDEKSSMNAIAANSLFGRNQYGYDAETTTTTTGGIEA